jgi:HAD superfamily hydrolase (TIGR01509 family)
MSLSALCLDFDGVIADTENIHVAAWQRTLAELGWEVSDEVCARAAEEDDRAFAASIFESQKVAHADVAGWVRRKQTLVIAMLQDSPRLYPGVAELAEALRGRLRLAVVTGTWRANVEAVLGASGLLTAFELIVAKVDVAAPKPAPDCYRLALQRLGLEPSRAVALEDSPSGLTAAREAGLRVLAVGHRRPLGEWVGSADFVPRLVPTAAVLEKLGL